MEPSSKLLVQVFHNTRHEIEEHMLVVMDKSTHEEHLSQSLQTNNKHFKIAVTFLTGYNGNFNVTNSKNKFIVKKQITGSDDFIHITIPQGSYRIEILNDAIKRIIIDGEHFTESDYPFQIIPIFSTLGSIIGISPQGPIISFVFDDGIQNLLELHETILWKEYNLSANPVDILLFDIFFLDCNIAKGTIYKQQRSGMIHNWTMTVNLGYKCVESFAGGITW